MAGVQQNQVGTGFKDSGEPDAFLRGRGVLGCSTTTKVLCRSTPSSRSSGYGALQVTPLAGGAGGI